jgi:hypothetical protein
MSADTNYNQAIQRGDARFLILTSDQAAYIKNLVTLDLGDIASMTEQDEDDVQSAALGESVLEQLEKR